MLQPSQYIALVIRITLSVRKSDVEILEQGNNEKFQYCQFNIF